MNPDGETSWPALVLCPALLESDMKKGIHYLDSDLDSSQPVHSSSCSAGASTVAACRDSMRLRF